MINQKRKTDEQVCTERKQRQTTVFSDRTVNSRFYPFEGERAVGSVRNREHRETSCSEIIDSYLVVRRCFSPAFYSKSLSDLFSREKPNSTLECRVNERRCHRRRRSAASFQKTKPKNENSFEEEICFSTSTRTNVSVGRMSRLQLNLPGP